MENIDKIETYTGSISIQDNDVNVVVASLSANVNLSTLGFSININPYDIELLKQEDATNIEGETPQEQYEDFEATVKSAAKSSGFIFFK